MPPRSLWLREALAAEDGAGSPELLDEVEADVCIVGGGYTGLWTALRVGELEPNASVVLVEAGICGGGPSGRNGGFALSWWPKVETLVERLGEEEGLRLVRASALAVDELGDFCKREGVDAHFRRGGWLWTATSSAQLGGWEGAVAAAERAGEKPFELLSAEEVQARTGSPVHLGAAFEAGAATVHPGLLARGLRRVALARGVRIHEHSPMVDVDRDAGVVRTRSGAVRAERIVLATGAWLAAVRELTPAVAAVSSDMIATAPMPERLEDAGWTGGESVSNCRLMVHYYRTTNDGRIAFGQGGHRHALGGRVDDEFFGYNPESTRRLEEDLVRLVPFAREIEITHAWGGPIDRTPDGVPVFGRLPGRARIVYGGGYSGNGVAPSVTAGKILASSVLGRDDAWSGSGLNRGVQVRFPPEPVRYLGGFVVRAAVRRKESREDDERTVDPLTRRLAGLAPQAFFRVNRR